MYCLCILTLYYADLIENGGQSFILSVLHIWSAECNCKKQNGVLQIVLLNTDFILLVCNMEMKHSCIPPGM